MRVKIGKFKHWIGPYQIADKLFFWVDRYSSDKTTRWDYKLKDAFVEFLCYGFQKKDADDNYLEDSRKESWFLRLCSWIHSKQKRVEEIHIDRWDTWNMDHTLALIVHPMLLQLKKDKHGAPFVDDEDVPEELRSTSAPPKENKWDTDDNHFKRWDYVLDEMSWAFQQHITDDEPDFWIEAPEGMHFKPCEDRPGLSTMAYDKEGKFDHDAYKAYHERKKNGFLLFGKYYTALWD